MTNSTTPTRKAKSTKASRGESTIPAWKAYERGYLAASSKNQVYHGEQRKRLAKPLMSP